LPRSSSIDVPVSSIEELFAISAAGEPWNHIGIAGTSKSLCKRFDDGAALLTSGYRFVPARLLVVGLFFFWMSSAEAATNRFRVSTVEQHANRGGR
jgi:hypothetical protein